MQAFDLLAAASKNTPPERTLAQPPITARGDERFDRIMGRVLAGSSNDEKDDSDDPPVKKSQQAEKADTSARVENLATGSSSPRPAESATGGGEGSASREGGATSDQAGSGALASAADGDSDSVATDSANSAGASGENRAAKPDFIKDLSPSGNKDPVEKKDQPAATPLVPGGEQVGGISGAKYLLPMQKTEKANEFSGFTEQNLPVEVAIDAGEEFPAEVTRPMSNAARAEKFEASTASHSSAVTAISPAAISSTASVSWSWPVSVRSLDRAHDLMAFHAMRLRESGEDSLRVVIKPDAGLQLSLELQMRDGAVEMRALLNRGNFEFLNLHWPELQQQLEARGIRLAPLACSDPADGAMNPFSQSNQRRPQDQTAGAFAEFALNSTLVPAPAKSRAKTASRGWESWA